jgi:hypothetical protein
MHMHTLVLLRVPAGNPDMHSPRGTRTRVPNPELLHHIETDDYLEYPGTRVCIPGYPDGYADLFNRLRICVVVVERVLSSLLPERSVVVLAGQPISTFQVVLMHTH